MGDILSGNHQEKYYHQWIQRQWYIEVSGGTTHFWGEIKTLINILDDNKSIYTVKDYSQAQLEWKIQNMIGFLSLKDYSRIVDQNQLQKYLVTRLYTMIDKYIFGPKLGYLKGNTVIRSGTTATFSKQIIPREIMEWYR